MLMNMVKGMMTQGLLDKVGSLVGVNSGIARTAINAIMPRILKGIASKGATESGATSLLNMIKNNGLGGNLEVNDNLMSSGGKLNDSLFGSSLKDVKIPGVSGDARSKLMNLATPLALGSLGKVVSEKNLDAKGLSSYLKDNVDVGAAATTATTSARTATTTSSGGGGLIKWLLPLLLVAALGWWLMQGKGTPAATEAAPAATETKTTKTTATHTHADGTVHHGHAHGDGHSHGDEGKTMATKATDAAGKAMDGAKGAMDGAADKMMKGLSLDDNGNLLRDGKLFLNKGEFTINDKGEYFDKDGKSLGFLAKMGKAIGDAGKAVGGAVGSAAGKTADFFKDSFGGMFKQKSEGGTVSAYNLSEIVFDKESHKITSFSKNEVEGLAAALKSYPDSKITVQATGGDKKLSKMKAQVIHDMLVTLGVSDKQISAKGMGEGAENFSIVID